MSDIVSPSEFQKAIEALQRQGAAPQLTQQQLQAIYRSLIKQGGFATGQSLSTQFDRIKEILNSLIQPQEVGGVMKGYNPATANTAISNLVSDIGAPHLAESGWVNMLINVAQQVSAGASRFVAMNSDPDRVDLYPGLSLERFYDRDVPRGFKMKGKTLIAVPDENWPSRWAAAGAEAGDDDWLDWDGDSQSGSGVALKSSGIWQALGDGAGGYEDTLGNPFPPFAFNSGFRTREVPRAQIESLGLLDPGEQAKPAPIDLGNLFAIAA